jgi:class 3 adenylate cyclase/DNA-binding NarL/FixJ family response regulator
VSEFLEVRCGTHRFLVPSADIDSIEVLKGDPEPVGGGRAPREWLLLDGRVLAGNDAGEMPEHGVALRAAQRAPLETRIVVDQVGHRTAAPRGGAPSPRLLRRLARAGVAGISVLRPAARPVADEAFRLAPADPARGDDVRSGNRRQKGIDMTLQFGAAVSAGARKRILVVDDSFIMRNLVKEIVESDPDLEVVDTAENGMVALKKVRQIKPDVVLLDIEMPEMSGLETLRRLGLRSPCKVVILSSLVGNTNSAERIEALRLGAVATIAKPSGGVSLDLRQKRASQIVEVLRKTLGLPALVEATSAAIEDQPLPSMASADFATGPIGDQLLEGLDTGVLVFDPEGSLIRANPAAGRILHGCDLSPGRATIGSLCDPFNHALGQEIWDVIGGGEAEAPAEINIATPDGEWVSVRRAIRPIVVSGQPRGVLVLLDDIAEKRRMQSLLEKTMSSDVARTMIETPEAVLEGAMCEVTILFCDIRGFTPLAEALGARRVVDLLNEFFSYMADVVGDAGGIVDKFTGDGIMALFGAPKSHGDDADRAVATARNMHRALRLMNERRAWPAIRIGVGLGSGPVIAGQIGAPDRMNYTVIGDPANLASRIEGVTKPYSSNILICAETFKRLTRPIPARKVDVIMLRGRETPTAVYEVFVEDPGATATEWLGEFDAGLSAYLTGDFVAAQAHLARAKHVNPDDMMADVLSQRCRRLGLRAAGEWTGAWQLTEQ